MIFHYLFITVLLFYSSIMLLYSQESGKSIKKIESINLRNVYQYTENLFSGSKPKDEESFKSLQELGIQTIISVDGSIPKLDLAHQYGMRYIHIPIAYHTITANQAYNIAKAVRDMTAPIYIHSHHGKQRGPTAASLSLVLLGEWDTKSAINAMEAAGTGKNYTGLYMAVDQAQKKEDSFWDGFELEFVEETQVSIMVDVMVKIQAMYDQLVLSKENGWRTPLTYPDTMPAHDASQLRELFLEFVRTGAAKDKDTTFKSMATASETAARALEDALQSWKPQTVDEEPPKLLNNTFNRVTRSCAACHTIYRNNISAGK